MLWKLHLILVMALIITTYYLLISRATCFKTCMQGRINLVNNKLTRQKSPLLDNSGIVLPLVLMLLVVFTLLGTAAYTASQSSLKQVTQLNPNLQAKYLARSAVDATKEAWTDRWIQRTPGKPVPVSAHFYTKYNDAIDDFVDATASEVGQDKVIETSLNYNDTTGICTITATATASGKTATVTAVSEGLLTEQSSELTTPWYENHRYTHGFWPIIWYSYSYIILPNPDSSEYTTDRNGRQYFSSYHYADGIVNLQATNASGTEQTIYLDERVTDYTAIGFQAKRIIFNSPLDLYEKGSTLAFLNPQALVVSAESINFNRPITIGDSAHGNLTLHLPDGFGISGEKIYHLVSNANRDKVNLTAKYGLVRFSPVTIKGSLFGNLTTNNPNLIQNKTFYFRHPDNGNSLNIGTEPNALSDLANLFGLTKKENDFLLKTLLDKGYLIPAPSGVNIDSDYDVLFVYQ